MPTREGWTALVASATAFASGRIFGLIELYVLGVGLAAIVAVALASVVRAPPQLRTQREVAPGLVPAGEEASVTLTLTNAGRRRSRGLELWEPVGGRGGAPMRLAALGRGERASASYRVPTIARGAIELGPLRATRRDVLGLCRRTTEIPGGERLLVVPAHHPVRLPGVGSGRLGQVLRTKAYGQAGSEFEALREYVVGDDLRRVHWKASARSTDLIVRETAIEGVRRCVVVLDRDAGQYDHDGFERAVSAAASVVTGAAAAGLTTRLVATGADLRGPTVAEAALRWLATVVPTREGGPPPEVAMGAGDGLGVVVAVTGTAHSPLVARLRRAINPEDTLVTVCASGPGGADGLAVDASSMDSFVGGWAALARSGSAR